MSAQANLSVALNSAIDATIDIGTVVHNILYNANYPLGSGSGADQIAQIFSDTRTIAASGTDDLDLAGSLINALGTTATFAKINGLLVKAASGNTNDVVVGGAVSNQFLTPFGAAAHTVKVKPGGVLLLLARDTTSYVVTAGTGDILRIANGGAGTGVTYDIILLGS